MDELEVDVLNVIWIQTIIGHDVNDFFSLPVEEKLTNRSAPPFGAINQIQLYYVINHHLIRVLFATLQHSSLYLLDISTLGIPPFLARG